MTSTTASRVFDQCASATFTHLTTLGTHEALIPLTTITARPAPARVGDVMVAISARIIRDVMVVTEANPPGNNPATPGAITLCKVGPLLLGTARIEVTPLGEHTCRVDWTEDIHFVAPLRPLSAAATGPLHLMTARALRVLAKTLEHQ